MEFMILENDSGNPAGVKTVKRSRAGPKNQGLSKAGAGPKTGMENIVIFSKI